MNNYTVVEKLGAGSMGSVDLVRDENKNLFALKTVLRKKQGEQLSKYVLREMEVGKVLKHSGVAAPLKSWEDEKGAYFLMEYIKGLDLISMMEQADGPLSESAARGIFSQIMEALSHVHSKGVAHRDMKLDNLMLDTASGKVKIIDFGLCKTGGAEECDGQLGSTEYCAPEIYKSKKTYNGYQADIWSCGVILFTLLFGCFPFNQNDCRLMKMGIEVTIDFPPNSVSADAKNIIKKMLTVDPKKRYNMKKVFAHKWMRN